MTARCIAFAFTALMAWVLVAPAAANDTATTPTLDRWAQLYVDRVELFRAENAKLEPGQRTIVFAGDSITQAMPVAALYPGLAVMNRGISSDGTADLPGRTAPHYRGLINRIDESILDPRPKVLFILIGTNDVGNRSVELDYWEENLVAILDRVKSEIPDCRVVLQTLPPSGPPYARVENLNPRVVEYNERLRKLAADRRLDLIDLYKLFVNDEGILPQDFTGDGLHLRREAYDLWAAEARKFFPEEL